MPTYTPKPASQPTPSVGTPDKDRSVAMWRIEGDLVSPSTAQDVKFSSKGNAFLPISIKSGKFYYRAVVFDAALIDAMVAGPPSDWDAFSGRISTRKNPNTDRWELELICTSLK